MGILANEQFANALGRPDLFWRIRSASSSPPVTVVGGSAPPASVSADAGSDPLGNGRIPLALLMALIGGYAAFTWWVRPHLA